jgi:chitinase
VYVVVAVDASGQGSAASSAVVVVVPKPVVDPPADDPADGDRGEDADVTPPAAPRGLALRGAGRLRLRLSWKAARDDVGVAWYRVERGGRLVVRTRARAVLLARRGLSAPTTLTVRAVDAAGNVGRPARLVIRRSALTGVRNVR